MTPRRLSDAALLASIREASAAWNAPQDTEYFATKHGYTPEPMHRRLVALEAAGKVTRTQRRLFGYAVDVWSVT